MPRLRQLRSRPKRWAAIRRYKDVIGGAKKGVHGRTPFYCLLTCVIAVSCSGTEEWDEKIHDNILGLGSDAAQL